MIRVLIVDDHQDFSIAISQMLTLESDITVVGTVNRGEEVMSFLEQEPVDVVLMDIRLGKNQMNGLETTQLILSTLPGMGIIILTGSSKDRWAEKALKAGISGYLTKNTPLKNWIQAIRNVYQGKEYFCPLAQKIQQKPSVEFIHKKRISLTPTETKIIRQIAKGLDLTQISQNLNHRLETIRIHRRNLLRKFGALTDTTLVHEAIRSGVLSVD